jgi:hypothetical protein
VQPNDPWRWTIAGAGAGFTVYWDELRRAGLYPSMPTMSFRTLQISAQGIDPLAFGHSRPSSRPSPARAQRYARLSEGEGHRPWVDRHLGSDGGQRRA